MVDIIDEIFHQRPQRPWIDHLLQLVEVMRAVDGRGEVSTSILAFLLSTRLSLSQAHWNVRCEFPDDCVKALEAANVWYFNSRAWTHGAIRVALMQRNFKELRKAARHEGRSELTPVA